MSRRLARYGANNRKVGSAHLLAPTSYAFVLETVLIKVKPHRQKPTGVPLSG